MPKVIELTVEVEIQRVSCPGVWLCQDGRVSLTVFALGTSYQTCLLPPVFPLMFKDVFYFRKRFQNSCTMNNICCMLRDENIYCELLQWCEDCNSGECLILAQYLGTLNDILFPPNLCSTEGVDLLMRRTKAFPGILSPKIEIATKVRIDEVSVQKCFPGNVSAKSPCQCSRSEADGYSRQRQVCHSAQYHRNKCSTGRHSRIRSRSRSSGSQSCCSLAEPNLPCYAEHMCPPISRRSRCRPSSPRRHNCLNPQYNVYNVQVKGSGWSRKYENVNNSAKNVDVDSDDASRSSSDTGKSPLEDKFPTYEDKQKTTIESRFIEDDLADKRERRRVHKPMLAHTPCVCQICKRYHELFHNDLESS